MTIDNNFKYFVEEFSFLSCESPQGENIWKNTSTMAFIMKCYKHILIFCSLNLAALARDDCRALLIQNLFYYGLEVNIYITNYYLFINVIYTFKCL